MFILFSKVLVSCEFHCFKMMTLFLITCLAFSCGPNAISYLHGREYPQGPPVWRGYMRNKWNNDNRFWSLGDRRMNQNNPAFNRNIANRAFGTSLDLNAGPIPPDPSRIKAVLENSNESNKFFNSPFTTTSPSTSTVAVPGMETTRTPCENSCPATSQFNPVCGDNGVTYTNMQWYRCALRCGRSVKIKYPGACPRPI